MEGFRYEVAATWKEIRWSVYFLVLLFPACLIAAGLASLVEGTPTPSPGLLFAFGVPLALLALFGAGLWDGVMGRLGRYIWWPLLLWFAHLLLRAYVRQAGIATDGEPPKERREPVWAVAAWLRDRRISWRELQRLKEQVTHDSADPRVRELRQLMGA
jgi:hypothetical protein